MAEPQTPPAVPPPITGLSKNAQEDLLEPGECVLTVVRRSFIGLLGIYLVATLAFGAIVTLFITLSPNGFDTSEGLLEGGANSIIAVAALLLALILFTVTYIYRQSRLLVTDRSLVQIMQKTLFIRKVSRLSMSNVEDVSEEQRGVLAHLFNYGTLIVQTAGEMENFIFTLCPNPARLADRIIEARQAYAQSVDGHDKDPS
jgi:hypothetical protein